MGRDKVPWVSKLERVIKNEWVVSNACLLLHACDSRGCAGHWPLWPYTYILDRRRAPWDGHPNKEDAFVEHVDWSGPGAHKKRNMRGIHKDKQARKFPFLNVLVSMRRLFEFRTCTSKWPGQGRGIGVAGAPAWHGDSSRTNPWLDGHNGDNTSNPCHGSLE